MMDMLMGPAALLLLLFLVALVAGVFITVRVLGARATRGDHPGESGYDPDQHSPR
ncbi:MAG: hypothetical protein WKF50_06815 [Nocardioides sp.]